MDDHHKFVRQQKKKRQRSELDKRRLKQRRLIHLGRIDEQLALSPTLSPETSSPSKRPELGIIDLFCQIICLFAPVVTFIGLFAVPIITFANITLHITKTTYQWIMRRWYSQFCFQSVPAALDRNVVLMYDTKNMLSIVFITIRDQNHISVEQLTIYEDNQNERNFYHRRHSSADNNII